MVSVKYKLSKYLVLVHVHVTAQLFTSITSTQSQHPTFVSMNALWGNELVYQAWMHVTIALAMRFVSQLFQLEGKI